MSSSSESDAVCGHLQVQANEPKGLEIPPKRSVASPAPVSPAKVTWVCVAWSLPADRASFPAPPPLTHTLLFPVVWMWPGKAGRKE